MAIISPEHGRKEAADVFQLLDYLKKGSLAIRDPDGNRRVFGDPESEVRGTMIVRDWSFFPQVLHEASLGLGESFMEAKWDAEDGDVTSVVGVLLMNDIEDMIRHEPMLLLRSLLRYAATKPVSRDRSQKNVSHHYDLGNDFFGLMLDRSMAYSCGIADPKGPNTLEEMQYRKFDLVCKKLELKPGQTLIDIGCGWGGLLFHAAQHYGVRATGITLSTEQDSFVRSRIREEKLEGKVSIECRDYREIEGPYDAFASIGMFEHVGDDLYATFMGKVRSLLKPGGKGLLHTIGVQQRVRGSSQDPWIAKYIFPGGHLPSLDRIVTEMEDAGFLIGHIENFKPHYAETLRHWKENVDRNAEEIRDIGGFDERFFRMWDFYLQSCEAGFRYGTLQLYQVLFSNGREWAFPSRFRF